VSASSNLRALLHLLRVHGQAVEADLQRYYNVDYRDRWRRHSDGVRRLTLRRIWVLLSHLPPDSAIAAIERDGQMWWSLEAHLLDDVRMTIEAVNTEKGKPKPRPHPDRRKKAGKRKVTDAGRRRKLAAARRRARDRRRRREAGDL